MEAQTYFLVIAISLFFLLNWLAKYYKLKPNGSHNLPPGPKKLPLIGNLHQLSGAASLPHHAFHKLAHKYGPLMHFQLGEMSTVIASSPGMAKEIMKTNDIAFVQRPQFLFGDILSYGGKNIVFAPYGDHWRQLKKICVLELLSAKRVKSFSFIREDETAKFIDSIRKSAGSPINLTAKIYSLVSASVFRAAFGGKNKDQDEFVVPLMRKVIEAAAGFDFVDFFPSLKFIHFITGKRAKLEELQKQVDDVLDNVVKEHEEKRKEAKEDGVEVEDEDFVDVLLRIQQNDTLDIKMTTIQIKALILDVFVAGSDTSASVLEWVVAEIMKSPRVMEKAQSEIREAFRGKETIHESDLDELNYLKLVIKETLRLHPPVPLLIPRECTKLTNIGGYEIPKKTKVMINAWALGRDPEYWSDAERFIPERFEGNSVDFRGNNFEYVPFGAGRRMCPGMTFGLASIMLPLALLLYHFNWELPNKMKPEDMDMVEHFGLVVGRENELRLIPFLYDP
ncbi:cytochrome P450 71D8-like [Phaseolus vulgaris]|uniref:Cytochrome P450 n=1 Tax=Phaseolus vulgaris TaxID=3885 RepID=V7CIY8_PHAVU|nr:hypothetical protein PHAVU_002G025100g [Phaseolus vulgaris]ESW28876.1 hypothetical protein PHAVU_002G025100g [Phaseolus vulgaris]